MERQSLFSGYNNKKKYQMSYLSQKTEFDISCKLSPLESICLKHQPDLGEKKKCFIMSDEIFTQHVKCELQSESEYTIGNVTLRNGEECIDLLTLLALRLFSV